MTYVTTKKSWASRMYGDVAHRLFAIRKRVQPRLLGTARDTRPVFVVGSGRSGTDLFATKLGQSLDVEPVGEGNPRAFDNWRIRGIETLREVLAESYAPVVMFKPIVETWRVVEFLDAFDHSRAVFVARDFRDTINSRVRFFKDKDHRTVRAWLATQGQDGFVLERASEALERVREVWSESLSLADGAALNWYVTNRSYHDLGLGSDPRVKLVFYQDVVARPKETLQAICRHADIWYGSRMIRDIFNSSVKKNPPPELTPEIHEMCAGVWERLSGQASEEDLAAHGKVTARSD